MYSDLFKTSLIAFSSAVFSEKIITGIVPFLDANSKTIKNSNDQLISNLIDNAIKADHQSIHQSINNSENLVQVFRTKHRAPGVSVAISHKGKLVWAQGFGFANLETKTPCTSDTVMRIASISKPITSVLVGRLVDAGLLDLNEPIDKYLNDKFPPKYVDGERVKINLKQLLSHTAGIRHYRVVNGVPKEFYTIQNCLNSFDALELFKNDDLLHKPGQKFSYTTFGYSVISAIVESVLENKKKFNQAIQDMCLNELGMLNTRVDSNDQLVDNRANYYSIKSGKLVNSPHVNNTCKVAGGGLLSNVFDLLKFGNVCIHSYKNTNGYLSQKYMEQMWQPLIKVKSSNPKTNNWSHYGLGWFVIKDAKPKFENGAKPPFDNIVYHSGGAVGASSFLLIAPEEEWVIAILVNLESCPAIDALAFDITDQFVKAF